MRPQRRKRPSVPFCRSAGARSFGRFAHALAVGFAVILPSAVVAAGGTRLPDATTPLASLPEPLNAADAGAALAAFRRSCRALGTVAPLRAAVSPPPALRDVCAEAERLPASGAAAFFATRFVPHLVKGDAFFTGYYEPVVAASPVATPAFPTPLLAPPGGFTTIRPGSRPGLDTALSVARRTRDGRVAALPDRAAIESGALGADAPPIAFVASPVEAFFIQVQGSARLRFPDGRLQRLVYAARNGYPYTSIGKILVARLGVPPSEMGMSRLRSWIENHGQGPGDEGTKLMRENRSFIFFRFDDALPADAGPIGAQGISLTAERSLAVDHNTWPYGLPFWVDTKLPDGTPFRRLMVAQDTGSAIVGRARADIFFGTGDGAAALAGPMRSPGTLLVLWPKSAGSAHP